MRRCKTLNLFVFLLTIWQTSVAQVCPCIQLFDSLNHHLKFNYPGYEMVEKRPDWPDWQYKSRSEIASTKDFKICAELLNYYVSFFQDGHLGIRFTGNIFKKEKVKPGIPAWPDISEDSVQDYLNRRTLADSLEGIWESYDGLYKVFIRKNQNNYTAFLLETVNQNWNKGEIKMIFEPDENAKLRLKYFMSAHQTKNPDFSLNRNILEIKNQIVFQKLYPKIPNPISFESYVSGNFGLSEEFLQWNPETLYIQLQNITAGNKPLIDSLIRKNDLAIRKSRNLIIDLRENGGGDFTCFENFWPYLLSDPAVVFGTTYHCTPTNVSAYKNQIKLLEGEIISDYQEFAIELEKHVGFDWQIPNDTIWVDQPLRFPQNVILLVNRNCKSSTENFILTARQSKKVIIAGETTGGVADYEEMVDFPLFGKDIILQMPIGKSNRLPVFPLNGIGIVPEIKLKTRNKAWQPWVKEVLKRL